MKVVIIKGSYHKNGVISYLTDKFIAGLKSENKDIEVKVFDLLDTPVEFCKGCGCCVKNDGRSIGECTQVDQKAVTGILQEMLECDILVYATPVYEKAVTALMKRLLERSMPVLYMYKAGPIPRNTIKKSKTGVVLLSCATPFPVSFMQGIMKYPAEILSMFCKAFGCGKVRRLKAPNGYSKQQLNDKYAEGAYRLGLKLAASSQGI